MQTAALRDQKGGTELPTHLLWWWLFRLSKIDFSDRVRSRSKYEPFRSAGMSQVSLDRPECHLRQSGQALPLGIGETAIAVEDGRRARAVALLLPQV